MLLGRAEVAKRLEASQKSVWYWIKAGRIKAVRFGRNFKVEESEVEWVKRHGLRQPTESEEVGEEVGDSLSDLRCYLRAWVEKNGTPLACIRYNGANNSLVVYNDGQSLEWAEGANK